jgi:hypothetical protein
LLHRQAEFVIHLVVECLGSFFILHLCITVARLFEFKLVHEVLEFLCFVPERGNLGLVEVVGLALWVKRKFILVKFLVKQDCWLYLPAHDLVEHIMPRTENLDGLVVIVESPFVHLVILMSNELHVMSAKEAVDALKQVPRALALLCVEARVQVAQLEAMRK